MKKFIGISLFFIFLTTACGGASPTAPAPNTQIPQPVTITQTAPATTSTCTDNASFVTDVTLNDYTNFDAGETFTKTWRIKNTGTCVWSERYLLSFKSGNLPGTKDSTPLKITMPGDTLDISVDLTAPSAYDVYRADFEIHSPAGAVIPIDKGTTLWVIITTGNATAGTGGGGSGTTSSPGPGPASATCAVTTNQTNVDEVVAAINAYRAQNGLPAYTVNVQLTQAAQSHSEDMACNNLFVHIGSNGSTPQSRVAATGYTASAITENVYGSYPALTGQGAVNWWITDQSDPTHNINLLSEKYIEIGVGYAYFKNYDYYVVDFAVP